MRAKLTARKSTGGKAPRNRQRIVDLQRRRILEEIDAEEALLVQQQMIEEDNINSENNNHFSNNQNNHVEMTNVVTPSNDKQTITAAVGRNDPARFQKLPIKMIPNASMETENKSPGQNSNRASTSGEHHCTEDNGSDDFTLQVSSHSDKTAPDDEPSSRILKENNACPKKNSRKRSNTSSSTPSETARKRKKKVEENLCKKFVDKLNDKSILLNELSQQIDLEELLEAYKENKSKEEIKNEAIRVLGLQTKEDTTNPQIVATLVKFLEAFSTLFVSDDFQDTVLNAMKGRLKAKKVLEVLDEDDVKTAVIEKFTPTGLFNLISQGHQSIVSKQLLKASSINEIINHVRSRNELNTSEPLLQVMLDSFSQVVPEVPSFEDTATMASASQTAVINAFTNAVKSRKCLSSSEDLLNVMLSNGPKILSSSSKENITNILKTKFAGPEFNDMSYEVTKYHLAERVIELN